MNEIIDSFRGPYAFLSNFYSAEVTYNGLTYQNNEAAFQAQKVLDDEKRKSFINLPPNKAKYTGRRVQLRSDWEDIKVGIMEDIVRAKFTQNPELASKLIDTGDSELIEGNNWRDTFWGVSSSTGKGQNHLGIILMKIRKELVNK